MKTTDKNNIKTYKMVLSAIMIALSVLLGMVAPVKLPFGGSVTFFSQVPLIAISWIFGIKLMKCYRKKRIKWSYVKNVIEFL